jgi:hypothetical protein
MMAAKIKLQHRDLAERERTNLDNRQRIALAIYPQAVGLRSPSTQDMVGTPRFLREENEKGIR